MQFRNAGIIITMNISSWLNNLISNVVGGDETAPLQVSDDAPLQSFAPRVLLVIYDPVVDPVRGTRLREYMNWNDPDELCRGYIADVAECSGGRVNYQIAERIVLDEFPLKEDGFRYDAKTYLRVMSGQAPAHQPDHLDYKYVIKDLNLIGRVIMEEIDEVWLFAFPYGGFYESRMVGENAFWCNSPEFADPELCGGVPKFVIMGFSYERGVGEMLENLGHRTESVMTKVYEGRYGAANLYERFIRYDQNHPGKAQVGWMHYAPNSTRDYDWGNPTPVLSACDDWLNFPHLTGQQKWVTCNQWGNGDIREHHKWWFHRLPKAPGSVDGIRCDWWSYVMWMDA